MLLYSILYFFCLQIANLILSTYVQTAYIVKKSLGIVAHKLISSMVIMASQL